MEVMDRYLESDCKKIDGPAIRKVVKDIFGIDLDAISAIGEGTHPFLYPDYIKKSVAEILHLNIYSDLNELNKQLSIIPKVEVMDIYLQYYRKKMDGQKSRKIINDIFGVNLDGIYSIKNARISLYSKGQWILQKDTDLITVATAKGDVDIKVYPTSYYVQRNGSVQLPIELKGNLMNLGFIFNEEMNAYHYVNPTGQSISEELKGNVFAVISLAIENSLSSL